ncbi:MAG: hypothetical protein OIN86_13120 [Candidatus Methanoperedens sp.]|nr:hypothetical protein [Candidatus Methanoperedens sp.]CAG0949079.1 hypothetical protein METP1_00079 [Methanosarcinales archaeon]
MTNSDNITENAGKKIIRNFREILSAKNEDFVYIEIPESEGDLR